MMRISFNREVRTSTRLMDEERKFRVGSGVHVISNILKIIVEGSIGILFGSFALIADALHTAGDLFASCVMFIVGGWAFEDSDMTHPHGHSRFEPIASIIVGVSLLLLASILIWDAGNAILQDRIEVTFHWLLFLGLFIGVILKLGAYYISERINKDINSIGLDALGKDAINDVFASIAAAIGVVGVIIGYPILDAVAAILVSIIVLWYGVQIIRDNTQYLVGRAPSQEKQDEIRETITQHEDVFGVHDLTAFYDGPGLEVEVHVEVESGMSIDNAHRLETEIVNTIQSVDEVRDAHVHLDPESEWQNKNN